MKDENEIELSFEEFAAECAETDIQCLWETATYARYVPDLKKRANDLLRAMVAYYEWFEDAGLYEFLDQFDNGYIAEDIRSIEEE